MQTRQELIQMIKNLEKNFNFQNFEHMKLLLFLTQSNMAFFNNADEDINQALLSLLNKACSQIDSPQKCEFNNEESCRREEPLINHFLSRFSIFHSF